MSNKPYSPDGETAELLQLAERQAKRIAEIEKAINLFCEICKVDYGACNTPCPICVLTKVKDVIRR